MGWDLLLTSQTNGLDFNKAILRVRTINLLEVRMRIILKVNRLWFEVKRGDAISTLQEWRNAYLTQYYTPLKGIGKREGSGRST